jgi:hypothetical protein
MVAPRHFKGIHYVKVSDLPVDQRSLILQKPYNKILIKIIIDDQIEPYCISYNDYKNWHEIVYQANETTNKVNYNNPN